MCDIEDSSFSDKPWRVKRDFHDGNRLERSTLDHWRIVMIRGTIPSTFSAAGKEKAQWTTARPVKQWDADKLGCVLETSWHSYRQTVVGSSQMLLDCPPSSNFTDSAPLFPVAASCRRRFQDERGEGNAPTKEEKRRGETLVEFDSNRVKRAQTWKREPGVLSFRNSTSNLLQETALSMIYKSYRCFQAR